MTNRSPLSVEITLPRANGAHGTHNDRELAEGVARQVRLFLLTQRLPHDAVRLREDEGKKDT